MKTALITGITGQDGSYLAELLLEKGYRVHGLVRPASMEDDANKLRNISPFARDLVLHKGSVDSYPSISGVIRNVAPDELYHLAAHSYVSYDFETEFSTIQSNGTATHYVLAAIKEFAPHCKMYFAGSSEMFGLCKTAPQNEETPFNPRSVYGISKVMAYHLVNNYRNHFGIQACVGFLYNHESPRRGFQYVTRKITSHAAKIKRKKLDKLVLGNLNARRDWGYAKDYVEAMWRMLQYGINKDYVIASGTLHSVRDFLEIAFDCAGLDYRDYVEVNEKFFRMDEDVPLLGDAQKAIGELGWKPTKTFEEIIFEMVDNDLKLLDI